MQSGSTFRQADRAATLEFTRPLTVNMELKDYPNGDILQEKTYWLNVDWGVFAPRDLSRYEARYPSLLVDWDEGTLLGPMWDSSVHGNGFNTGQVPAPQRWRILKY